MSIYNVQRYSFQANRQNNGWGFNVILIFGDEDVTTLHPLEMVALRQIGTGSLHSQCKLKEDCICVPLTFRTTYSIVLQCKTTTFATKNDRNCNAKRLLLHCKTIGIATQNDRNCSTAFYAFLRTNWRNRIKRHVINNLRLHTHAAKSTDREACFRFSGTR